MGSETSHLQAQAEHSSCRIGHAIPSCADALGKIAEALEQGDLDDVPNKFERMATGGHLQVDWELVRGLSLRDSLRCGGWMWWRSPALLDDSARAAIWNKSHHVKKFDMFLSHTWKTSGIQKVLALLLQSGYKALLLFWFFGVIVTAQLSASARLPLPWKFDVELVGMQANCLAGPWVLLASVFCSLLGLLASPYLRWPGSKDDCFIDVASIHQTDAKLMERGIYGIGGFLSISRELRVLWSPGYLTRLWCVFELAAYRTANPGGKITLAPLFVEVIVYVGVAMNVAVACVWWMARMFFREFTSEGAALITALLPCFGAMHFLRKTFMSKHKLICDLEHFDLCKVQCSNDFDKEFIYGAIEEWYGSKEAFTAFVRGPLRAELLETATSSHYVAYSQVLLTPTLASGLTLFASLCAGGAHIRCIAAYVFGSFLAFNVCFLLFFIALVLYLCDRFAEPRWSGLRDLGQTLMLYVPLIALFYGAAWVSRTARACSVCASLAWFAATLLCTLLTFKSRRLI